MQLVRICIRFTTRVFCTAEKDATLPWAELMIHKEEKRQLICASNTLLSIILQRKESLIR